MTPDNTGPDEASFSQAKIANEVIKVEKCKHQLQQLNTSVIDRQDALIRITELIATARERWQGWPKKSLAGMAKRLGVKKPQLQTLLQPSIEQHLQELGEINVRLD